MLYVFIVYLCVIASESIPIAYTLCFPTARAETMYSTPTLHMYSTFTLHRPAQRKGHRYAQKKGKEASAHVCLSIPASKHSSSTFADKLTSCDYCPLLAVTTAHYLL